MLEDKKDCDYFALKFSVIELCDILVQIFITYRNYPKFSDRQVWANSVDPNQTAPWQTVYTQIRLLLGKQCYTQIRLLLGKQCYTQIRLLLGKQCRPRSDCSLANSVHPDQTAPWQTVYTQIRLLLGKQCTPKSDCSFKGLPFCLHITL